MQHHEEADSHQPPARQAAQRQQQPLQVAARLPEVLGRAGDRARSGVQGL
jgi:hypothetical protein